MLSITKTFEFAASHRLSHAGLSEDENRERFGKCANLHGHNYRLEVSVAGPVSEETGMILDTRVLQQLVERCILSELDHKSLSDDVSWLKGKLPSTENIINAIWDRLQPEIANHAKPARLSKLVLWETSRIFAVREEG
jgi:6-pyruvoyltetrahydropterin/6-carboxytetrahydropterin synthase